jgi:isoleucyl-tRNA synthetase
MTILSRNSNNREEVKEAVSSLRPEIQRIFGAELQSKVVNLLDSNFEKINDIIESKFNEMRESHRKDKEEIIQAIERSQNEVARLTHDN